MNRNEVPPIAQGISVCAIRSDPHVEPIVVANSNSSQPYSMRYLNVRALWALSTILLAKSLLGGALASDRDAHHFARLRRQNSGSNDVEKVASLPTYAKVPTLQAVTPSISSVEDIFHRQYQQHKDRLGQPIFEEQVAEHLPLDLAQRKQLHEQRHKLMAVHFQGLRNSNPVDRPLFLNGINQLRHPTQVYPEDAGASLKLGQSWKFELHGPYPALRLASLASHNSPSSYMPEELRNADNAIRLQTNLDNSGGTYRGLPAFTDNLSLLKTARDYFGSAYAQRDWRGTGIEELELIGERTAKRLRL